MRRETGHRYGRDEFLTLIASCRSPRSVPVGEGRLDELVAAYAEITGEALRPGRNGRPSPARGLLAVCGEIHGDQTEARLREAWAIAPTTVNLLADVRLAPPRTIDDDLLAGLDDLLAAESVPVSDERLRMPETGWMTVDEALRRRADGSDGMGPAEPRALEAIDDVGLWAEEPAR